MNFSSIVIAGGALKVISVIGCIKYLEEHNLLNKLKTYVGSSAGTIMCLFLILNYSYKEIIELLVHVFSDENINKFDPEECFNIISDYGISSGKNLEKILENIIYKKLYVKDVTFMELSKLTGKNFVICVSNLTKEKTEYFNIDNMPFLSVIKAIRISCSIPLLFTPLSLDDNIYMDGSLYNNFPINYFEDNKLEDILGININFVNYKDTSNFLNYIFFLLNSLINDKINSKKTQINDNLEKNIVTIEFNDDSWFSLMDLKLIFPKENWVNYINIGYNKIKEKLDKS